MCIAWHVQTNLLQVTNFEKSVSVRGKNSDKSIGSSVKWYNLHRSDEGKRNAAEEKQFSNCTEKFLSLQLHIPLLFASVYVFLNQNLIHWNEMKLKVASSSTVSPLTHFLVPLFSFCFKLILSYSLFRCGDDIFQFGSFSVPCRINESLL